MTHHHIAVLKESPSAGESEALLFEVETGRTDPLTLRLPRRQWDQLGQPYRLRVAIDAVQEGHSKKCAGCGHGRYRHVIGDSCVCDLGPPACRCAGWTEPTT